MVWQWVEVVRYLQGLKWISKSPKEFALNSQAILRLRIKANVVVSPHFGRYLGSAIFLAKSGFNVFQIIHISPEHLRHLHTAIRLLVVFQHRHQSAAYCQTRTIQGMH